jgi:predicted Zn-ribbon and HTH transcriptional regulator
MTRVIVLGGGRQVTIGQYVQAVKLAKANKNTTFKRSLCSDWIPATGQEIVWEFLRGVQDRINKHMVIMTDKRKDSRLLKHIRNHGRKCKNCGRVFFPKTVNDHFCSPDCNRQYYW